MIVQFIDPNVDGCGTDVSCFIDIETSFIKSGLREAIHKAVDKYKAENFDEWDSDGVFNTAFEAIEKAGYKARFADPVDTIEL